MRFDPDKHRAYSTFESACRARRTEALTGATRPVEATTRAPAHARPLVSV
jgi:hypothetical protein